jgi:general secretion pathway protein D
VGITLTVTPQVNEGDSVVLDIVQEVSSLSTGAPPSAASDVITNERKIRPRSWPKDRDMVVLGGLVKDDVQDVSQGAAAG